MLGTASFVLFVLRAHRIVICSIECFTNTVISYSFAKGPRGAKVRALRGLEVMEMWRDMCGGYGSDDHTPELAAKSKYLLLRSLVPGGWTIVT